MASSKDWHDRVSRGLCGYCGKNPPVPDKKECSICREYRREKQKERYHGGSGTVKARAKMQERILAGQCYNCGNPPENGKKSCSYCLDKQKERRDRYKDVCYEKYGGYICSCCGETEKCFLTLDHINGDGHKYRKESKIKSPYKWIINNNFPPIYQVLCFNCNCGRQINGGICPHKSNPGYRRNESS